jgi:hypothetical protein
MDSNKLVVFGKEAADVLEFDSVIILNGRDEDGNLDGTASVDDEIDAEVLRNEKIDNERRILT